MANEISIPWGNDRTLSVSVVDEDGTAVSLASAEIVFMVKNKLSDADTSALITKKNTAAGGADSQITITNAAGGLAEIYIVPSDFTNISLANEESVKYYYDCKIKLSSAKQYSSARSTFTITGVAVKETL